MRYTFGWLGVVESFDVFALADHMQPPFGNIHNSLHILPFVLFANEEFVLGGESNSAALANEPKEGHMALYQAKIVCAPVIVVRWKAKPGVGYELLRCFALQGRQTVHGVYGGFHALYRLVKLPFRFEGMGPKQETSQQTVEVLHHPVTPGLSEWNEDRLYTQIQADPHELAWGTWIQVAASKIQTIVHLQVPWTAHFLPGRHQKVHNGVHALVDQDTQSGFLAPFVSQHHEVILVRMVLQVERTLEIQLLHSVHCLTRQLRVGGIRRFARFVLCDPPGLLEPAMDCAGRG